MVTRTICSIAGGAFMLANQRAKGESQISRTRLSPKTILVAGEQNHVQQTPDRKCLCAKCYGDPFKNEGPVVLCQSLIDGFLIPAQAGIHHRDLDSRLRWNDRPLIMALTE